MRKFARQQGITLIEMMISLAIGLFVISVASSVYITTVINNLDTVAASRLNQEMTTLMNVMIQDLRRAGYSGDLAILSDPLNNDFNDIDDTALTIITGIGSPTSIVYPPTVALTATNYQGSCVLYSYDADLDAVVDDDELFGFRLNNGVVQMRQEGVASAVAPNNGNCNDTTNDDWLDVTDGTQVNVTALTFTAITYDATGPSWTGSFCFNSSEPDGIDDDGDSAIDNIEEEDCYRVLPDAGEITAENRELLITLQAELLNEPEVRLQLQQTVKVRNDLLRER